MLGLSLLHACGGAAPADPTSDPSTVGADQAGIVGGAQAAQVPASPQDLQASTQLRRAILSDAEASVDARNISVITRGGVMVLRGGIANQAEQERILTIARELSGVREVHNQMQILSQGIAGQPGGTQ